MNPFINLLEWLSEEEIKTQNFILTILSLNSLINKKDIFTKEKENIDTILDEINSNGVMYKIKNFIMLKFLYSETEENKMHEIEKNKLMVSQEILLIYIRYQIKLQILMKL